ncbi:MAG TPA: sigma factor-like helix-turn-helix DNA-binding protein, partial [bacterium]|nr:sigma factor-like helix-turn-helix DNA-binding protein [bacterium]
IERTLETLPPSYRMVFVLREMEEMSVADTAAVLGISTDNAKVRLHRAKKLLREGLRRQMPDIGLYSFLGERCDTLTARVMARVRKIAQRQTFPQLSPP